MVATGSVALLAASSLLAATPCAGFALLGGVDRRRTSPLGAAPNARDIVGESAVERRELLDNLFRAAISTAAVSAAVPTQSALALDFDAFESSAQSSSGPEYSEDEALCKFGAPGKAMGEACKRAGMKPRLPSDVDASGKVDRGDYLKCKFEYPVIEGQYVKTRVCKPSSEWGPP